MGFIRKHSNLWFLLILPMYFYIVQTSIRSKHTHFYSNGVVVTHSHPLDQSSDDPIHHKHSKTEICFFSNHHFDLFTLPPAVEADAELPESHYQYLVENLRLRNSVSHFRFGSRAPPAC